MAVFGIISALIALVCWGFGDFFIQRATRAVGSIRALFFITFFTAIVLLPFVISSFTKWTRPDHLLLLFVTGIVAFFTAFFNFEGFRLGKLSVVAPILSLELPLTAALAFSFRHEQANPRQIIAMILVFVGVLFIMMNKRPHWFHRRQIFEKGVILGGFAAIGLALGNIFIGVSSQDISPVVTIWFTHAFIALTTALLMIRDGQWSHILTDIKKHPKTLFAQWGFDNVAWLSFAFATTFIPIAIATAISESYIGLAVILGVVVNKEKLRQHQMLGMYIAFAGIVALAFVTK